MPRRGLITSLIVAVTVGSQFVLHDLARAGACVDRSGAPDDTGVAVEPITGAWCLDGTLINVGSRAEGLAMNFRAINAAIDDANPDSADRWDYPGGVVNGVWDDGVGSGAARNSAEFAAALPTYSGYGLDLVTVGMQGGHPRFQCLDASGSGARDFSMFASDGTLREDAKARLQGVIEAAHASNIIVSVQFFYQNQDHILADDAAVITATDQATTFLRDLGSGNVVIEVANETSDKNYLHPALEPAGMPDRIDQIHAIWPEALVSVSMSGGGYPTAAIAERIDWASFHANGLSAAVMATRIQRARSDPLLVGKPVVVTEDRWGGPEDDNASVVAPFDDGYALNPNLEAAIDAGAGWGFYEQGCEAGPGESTEEYADADPGEPAENFYANGLQSPPVNWVPTSGEGAKIDFFTDVAAVTSVSASESPSPTETESPSPTETESPSPSETSPSETPTLPPSDPVARPLATFHTGSNGASYATTIPGAAADEAVLVVVGSTATNSKSRVPTLSGSGMTFLHVGQVSFQPDVKFTSRIDAFVATQPPAASGVLTIGFGATQTDVHVAVMALRDDAGPVAIGEVVAASGSGKVASIDLDGAATSRTMVTVLHAAKEGSQPGPGSLELADTKHGSRPSGMASAWWPAAFEPVPSYGWNTSSAWAGLAFEVQPVPPSG